VFGKFAVKHGNAPVVGHHVLGKDPLEIRKAVHVDSPRDVSAGILLDKPAVKDSDRSGHIGVLSRLEVKKLIESG